MRCVLALLLLGLTGNAMAASYDERMSVRDLYYKLLRESEAVKRDEERADIEQRKKERAKVFRHHEIQRIGPDPEEDLTVDAPVTTDILENPYPGKDRLSPAEIENSPLDQPRRSKHDQNEEPPTTEDPYAPVRDLID